VLVASVAAFAAAGAAGASPSATAAAVPRVDAMVVDKSGDVFGPRPVAASRTRVRASGKRCRVGQGLPLSALAAAHRAGGPGFRNRGPCDSIYVFQVGSDREAGRGGWVYKVDQRLGTVGAADPTGPFGDGRRLRTGQRVLWYWCNVGGRCQRTLGVRLSTRITTRGTRFRVRALAYDDNGRGRHQRGVQVSIAGSSATTGPDGLATLTAPRRPGAYRVAARATGLIPAFPEVLTVR
jgi:hypothetical protein